jgi:predicted site-specific integrase-resolvase
MEMGRQTLTLPSQPAAIAVISFTKWREQVGVAPCTAWRWRKKGWLKTINIAGRLYLSQEAITEFQRRAEAGEFAKVHKTPSHKKNSNKI